MIIEFVEISGKWIHAKVWRTTQKLIWVRVFFKNIFGIFTPKKLGKIFSLFDGCIFFKGVEGSTTNQCWNLPGSKSNMTFFSWFFGRPLGRPLKLGYLSSQINKNGSSWVPIFGLLQLMKGSISKYLYIHIQYHHYPFIIQVTRNYPPIAIFIGRFLGWVSLRNPCEKSFQDLVAELGCGESFGELHLCRFWGEMLMGGFCFLW